MTGNNADDDHALPDAATLGVTSIVHKVTVTSTMDEVHARATSGAPAGTLLVADEQTSGRGRNGNVWLSQRNTGVWMTLLERPTDTSSIDVLALRLGLVIAETLDDFVASDEQPLQLKWPNDVYANTRKLAGILVEARWRDSAIEWIAIGIGINLHAASVNQRIATLRANVSRNAVLRALMPPLRVAARAAGPLTDDELARWRARDMAVGREITTPVQGVVQGITASGALTVRDASGVTQEVRSGPLTLGLNQNQ